jgi:hypothetical protein
VLLPTVVGYLPLWEGMATFTAQRQRLPMGSLPGVQFLIAQGPLIVVYLLLSAWLLRRGRERDWPTAWAVLSVALSFLLTGMPYPWYLIWPLSVSLTRWDRGHLALSAACLGMAVVWTMGYTVLWIR